MWLARDIKRHVHKILITYINPSMKTHKGLMMMMMLLYKIVPKLQEIAELNSALLL